MLRASLVVALILPVVAPPGLRADVTIRYQSDFKPSVAMQSLMERFMKTVQASSEVSFCVKENKSSSIAGNWTQIFDAVTQDVTLIDPAHKTFTTLPLSELTDRITGAIPSSAATESPAVQQIMASIKTNVTSQSTGKTAEILGVQAEEREITLTMDLPQPMGANSTGPGIRLVIHIWTAKAGEAMRVPAIRELTGYTAWQRYILNPAAMLQKLAGRMPGMSKAFTPMFEEMFKNPSVILRMHMEMFMPFMAAMQAAGHGSNSPAIDPNVPIMEINREVAELSTTPVDAALFEIPKGFTAVPADEMIRQMLQPPAAPK